MDSSPCEKNQITLKNSEDVADWTIFVIFNNKH